MLCYEVSFIRCVISVLYCFVLMFLWVFALVLTLTEECPLGRSCGFFATDVEDFS